MSPEAIAAIVFGCLSVIGTVILCTASLAIHISSRLTRIETTLESNTVQQQGMAETLEEHRHDCDRNRVEINGRLADHERRFLRLEPRQ